MESDRKLDILIEKNIPFIKGLLEPYARVRYLAPEEFTPEAVADVDAMIIRTRTRCDEQLLGGSRCRFIATATIGTDHIDLDYCHSRGIAVANAPGCNAPAVAQYVFASILALANRPLRQYTLGVVGVGHVGSIVEQWGRQLDMEVLVNDPPRQQAEGGDGWTSLDEMARRCDIITFHTPLDNTTRHMVDAKFIDSLERSPIIINAARGPVVDTPALVAGFESGKVHHAVIDCWENEPHISSALLAAADIATPHIAGYSYEGKVRATRMALDALTTHFGLPRIAMQQEVPEGACSRVLPIMIYMSYNPLADTKALRAAPANFEGLRNNYNLRHEVPELNMRLF